MAKIISPAFFVEFIDTNSKIVSIDKGQESTMNIFRVIAVAIIAIAKINITVA